MIKTLTDSRKRSASPAKKQVKKETKGHTADGCMYVMQFYKHRFEPSKEGWELKSDKNEQRPESYHFKPNYENIVKNDTWHQTNAEGETSEKNRSEDLKRFDRRFTPIPKECTNRVTYLVQDIEYQWKDNPSIVLREIEAEYPDGDLHHYYDIRVFGKTLTKDAEEVLSKYRKCRPCRSKIMEYLWRYERKVYDQLETLHTVYKITGTCLSSRDKRGLLSKYGNGAYGKYENRIIAYRTNGLFSKYPDPRKGEFEAFKVVSEQRIQEAKNDAEQLIQSVEQNGWD